MQIESHEIQLITADLDHLMSEENHFYSLLSEDERERAHRFQFPIHRQRFIATRGLLRTIISLYTETKPQEILFSYDYNKKPSLQKPENTSLQFNLSHSHERVVYAFTLNHAIGVDIEKVQDDYPEGVAERYFNKTEYDALLHTPLKERSTLFYKMWARKEALVKTSGKGIFAHDSFNDTVINHDDGWSVLPINIHPEYQSAVATHQTIKKITYFEVKGECDVVPIL